MADMRHLLGMTARSADGSNVGRVVNTGDGAVEIRWIREGMLSAAPTIVTEENSADVHFLTLTEGWQEYFFKTPGQQPATQPRTLSLLEDIRQLHEKVKYKKNKGKGRGHGKKDKSGQASGKSLELKAREKRITRKKLKAKKKGGHNPFKTKTNLGPGPRSGVNKQTHRWKCACRTPYKCSCKGPGGKRKTIRIRRGYKRAYNHQYKSWRKGQQF